MATDLDDLPIQNRVAIQILKENPYNEDGVAVTLPSKDYDDLFAYLANQGYSIRAPIKLPSVNRPALYYYGAWVIRGN